ncbi:hypothetical protein EV424DRAFT_1341182 [Suillus variegatus]|nr:hypothetical protein EV424DRAFT_1341182 [Suillus variegatus]
MFMSHDFLEARHGVYSQKLKVYSQATAPKVVGCMVDLLKMSNEKSSHRVKHLKHLQGTTSSITHVLDVITFNGNVDDFLLAVWSIQVMSGISDEGIAVAITALLTTFLAQADTNVAKFLYIGARSLSSAPSAAYMHERSSRAFGARILGSVARPPSIHSMSVRFIDPYITYYLISVSLLGSL